MIKLEQLFYNNMKINNVMSDEAVILIVLI